MIAERLPALMSFSNEEKWQVVMELQDELIADDPMMQEPLKSEMVRVLEERLREYEADPSVASPWSEVRQRLQSALAHR